MLDPRPKVAVVVFSPIQRDARVLRQIRCLAERYDVAVVAYGALPPGLPDNVAMHPLPEPVAFLRRNLTAVPKLMLGRVWPQLGYTRWYWDRPDFRAAFESVCRAQPQLIVANDWDTLPLSARAAEQTGARIVLDLHEYSPLHWNNRRVWMALIAPMITHCLRTHGGAVARFLTVNQSIADRYREEFGFDATVILNAPESSAETAFRATDPSQIHLVHHGLATPDRKLEGMIHALAQTDARYHLHFMLVPTNPRYVARLRQLATQVAPGRVSFEEPVSTDRVVATIARYDMGIFILPPITFNYHMALPNKFFDFVSAGLATCTGPSPEMARISRELGFGIVTESFEPAAVARALNSLGASQIDELKRHAIAARTQLCAQVEMTKLRELFTQVLG